MKIVHVLYSGLGGHGNVFFSMVSADKKNEFKYEAVFNGIEDVRQEYIERCNELGIKWSFVKKHPGLDIRFYKNLVTAIKKTNSEIIFLHGSTQILWAKIAAILKNNNRIIVVRETQANHLKTKQDWLWLVVAMTLTNKIVFLTEAYHLEIKKKLSWVYRKKKVAIISNGIDLELFKPKLKVDNTTVVIGMQSRIVKIKDHQTLIQAFAVLLKNILPGGKNIILKIAGDGNCKEGLEQLCKVLKIDNQVEFTGMLTEQELVIFLQQLDIYVHASFGETMSTSIMQAMACGKPVIASNVAGINNMIENDVTGLLVSVENIEEMCKALKLLINSTDEKIKLAENARQYAEVNFSKETMFAKYKNNF